MKRLRHSGTVVSIGTHHSSPDHIHVSVAHGPKKKAKKGDPFPSYDDRPQSTVMLPKAHADQLKVGQRVNVGIGGSSTDEDMDDAAPYRKTMRGIARPC
jgi:hypothetical protein